jgi:hypothetical protein
MESWLKGAKLLQRGIKIKRKKEKGEKKRANTIPFAIKLLRSMPSISRGLSMKNNFN